MQVLKKIRDELRAMRCPIKALSLQHFFKTEKGTYGERDKFLGITVPKQRKLAKHYCHLSLSDLTEALEVLLSSSLHEERMLALLILVLHYQKADLLTQKKIYNFFFANISGVNNWDLVDLSAPHIVGAFLLNKDKSLLHKLVISQNLWSRRIAIVATLHFIRHNFFKETLSLAKKLLSDKEDLMHKATGWMLREIGKRDLSVLAVFLHKHYQNMPRTMLRYAIEKFPEKLRLAYLHGRVPCV